MNDRPDPTDRHSGPSDAELDRAVPRETGGRELRVGIFVIVGIISFITVLFLLTDPATLRGRYMLVTSMRDAGGVRRGDPIQMRGVNIGRIHGFEMMPDGNVNITMEVEGDWEIPEGSSARLGEVGLFGGRTMQVIPGTRAETMEPWDTLAGVSEGPNLFETVGALGTEASTVLEQLNQVLDDPTVGAIRGTAAELEGLVTELRRLARIQQEELSTLTRSLNRSAASVEDAAESGPALRSAITRADSALLALNRTTATLEEAAESLNLVMARMEAGEGTLGRLSRDDALYVNLNQAAEAVASLAADIQANPRRYLDLKIF